MKRLLLVALLVTGACSDSPRPKGAPEVPNVPAVAGWQQGMTQGLHPYVILDVESAERNAVLFVQCSPVGPFVAIKMHGEIFNSSGENVFMDARFLPDTTIQKTDWVSLGDRGSPNVVMAGTQWNMKDNQQMLRKLQQTDKLQIELVPGIITTFAIRNHDVLDAFLAADCQ